MDISYFMPTSKKRFCSVINHYCDSLAMFIETVKHPTEFSIKKIHDKEHRSNKFDVYVLFVETFNELTNSITNIIKRIIMTLNDLFINKTIEKLVKFLSSIQDFLIFLIDENIFMKLTEVQKNFNQIYKDNTKFLEKLDGVRTIIFRIFNISVKISSIFIPEIAFVTPVLNKIEQKVIHHTDEMKATFDCENIDIDSVIKSLLDTQLRSEIIANVDINIIYDCMHDKQSQHLLNSIEHLQTDYISMTVISIALRTEISFYRKRKKNIFSKFIAYCK